MELFGINSANAAAAEAGRNQLNRQQIAAIIFNETRSLSGAEINSARKNIAHVILNHVSAGTRLPLMAPAVAIIPASESSIYQNCLEAVDLAQEELAEGIDPTKGATNFNFRRNASESKFFQMPVHTHAGPLHNSFPTAALPSEGIYANTYGLLKE